jgi:lipase
MDGLRILTWGAADAPAVVCIHGVCGHARRFERLARMLEGSAHVVAYDLRGHGRSPWSGPQTLAGHAADLDDVLDACGIEQATLVGHSFGGLIALVHAATRADRVTALVLLDPPLLADPVVLEEYAAREQDGRTYQSVDGAMEARSRDARLRHTPRALLEEEMAEHLVAGDDGLFRLRYSGPAAAAALREMGRTPIPLKDVVCPTLLVRAEESHLLSAEAANTAAAEMRRCRLEIVPGSHSVLWDALAETSALVRDFLVQPSRA